MKRIWLSLCLLALLAPGCNSTGTGGEIAAGGTRAPPAPPATRDPPASIPVPTVPAPATPVLDAGPAQTLGEGYISFIINTHDIVHVNQSADVLLRLLDLYERHGVRGDFYLTAPLTHLYQEQRPDVIARLRDSDMTISYHVRAPHPLAIGFDYPLQGLSDAQAAALIRDYETYRLDLETGELDYSQDGGYRYVAETFGRPPVVASVADARWRELALPIYAEMGAQVTVISHETGTDLEEPFEWVHGLLSRPSDFSLTRWKHPDNPGIEDFWWNMLRSPLAADYNPTAYLQAQLDDWAGPRPPFVTVIIHENNFFRRDHTPYALMFWEDERKTTPRQPPYDLAAPDPSQPRDLQEQEAIWAAYEELVSHAAANLAVVTSEDLVHLANTPGTAVEPPGEARAPLFITTMTHMEIGFPDDVNQAIFQEHVEQLRFGMDLFDEYGARLTIESERPFARANTIWGVNILREVVDRGHGVGTHCDTSPKAPRMHPAEYATALQENKTLVDALVGPEHNRGCSGAGGRNDWAIAADLAGFEYLDGIVGLHYLAMPLENRPDPSWTDEHIFNEVYHKFAPIDLTRRIHPFRVSDASDFEPDEDGIILVSAGTLGQLAAMAEGGGVYAPGDRAPLTDEDVDAMIAAILSAAELHDPAQVGKLTVYLAVNLYTAENEATLRYFLSEVQKLVDQGLLTWATQGEVYDAFMAWNP